MSITSYILGIVAAVASLVFVVELLRRGRLRERHAIWWMIASLVSLLIGIFPGILTSVARLVGISVPTNLVFFVSIAVLFLVCIQYATELTLVEERNRRLAETVALLEMRVSLLEGAPPTAEVQPESDDPLTT